LSSDDSQQKVSATIEPEFGKAVHIQAPPSSTSVLDLLKDFQNSYSQALEQQSSLE